MRVVVDTNVFISSFFGGNPRTIINRWANGRLTLCLSREIVAEYVDVLQRLGLTDREELDRILSLFAGGFNCLFTASTPDLQIVSDPDDDKFIECTVALNAQYVISGDQALLNIKNYMNIQVVNPKQFLDAHLD